MEAGFGLGQAALLDEVGNEGVIARDALELVVVKEIRARIAHLCDDGLVFVDEGGGEGRSHARFARTVLGAAQDGLVCLDDGCAKCLGARALGSMGFHGGHGDLARDLAGLVSAHAVCDDEERAFYQVAVLIVLAYASDIRARGERSGRVGLGEVETH